MKAYSSLYNYPRPLKDGLVSFLLLVGFLFLSITNANAQQNSESIAKIVSVEGTVEVLSQGSSNWQPAYPEQPLYPGDTVRTGADGKAFVRTSDESLINLSRHSRLIFEQVASNAGWLPASISGFFKSIYEFCSGENGEEGEMSFFNKNRNVDIDFKTPLVRASVRGTGFTLKVKSQADCTALPNDRSVLTMLEGRVNAINVQNERDRLLAETGDRVIAEFGKALQLERLQITPEDAVQWALFIPPLFEQQDIAHLNDPALAQALQNAYDSVRTGEVLPARNTLSALVEQYPQQSSVWRLFSLTNLALNRKQEALLTAQRSTETAPGSAAAWITLSYAYQALFDLKNAETAVQWALIQEPDHVLALVNLSRLQFGRDDINNAWKTMQTALKLAPEEAEVHNLRGFLLLAKQDTSTAVDALQNAIRLNSRLAEPHLGLGLAYMRQGKEKDALQEIATAVLLEPRRSLFLSYWAKMLYQLKRYDKALDMLELARRYDPQDPTPLLYEGLILRDLNRPTAAIQALNNAIRLNDRRAVYRSRFLLDRDLAVKNADLSELYKQLGFNAWAKNKATASVKQDYFNASAHNFLAGVLAEQDDRAWPQAGEALLGRLLQSGSINSFNTYNDYTALLEQPEVNGSFSITHGNHDRFDSQLLAYGSLPKNRIAFGAAATYLNNNGWRGNDEDRFEDLTGILKWDLSDSDSLLFSVSHFRQQLDGERFTRLEFDALADPAEFVDSDSTQLELGYRHHFGPKSDFLLFFSWLDFDSTQRDHSELRLSDTRSFDTFITTDFESPYYQAQAQYMVGTGNHQLLAGTLHYWIDNRSDGVIDDRLLDENGQILSQELVPFASRSETRFQSYYVQDIWTPTPQWTIEAALHFEKSDIDTSTNTFTEKELNPRFGVIWSPTEQNTFRVAAFRYLLPRISARLDPMDVAGVTLFRNSLEGSLAQEANFVWEREWDSGFLSTNLFYQELEFSIEEDTVEGNQKGLEIELNQLLPWQGMGLSARYRYLDMENDDILKLIEAFQPFSDDPVLTDRQEHQFTLGLNYLNPKGFSAGLTQTYRSINSVNEDRPDEDIWVTDFRIGYEFSDKRGAFDLEVRNILDREFNWALDPFATGGLLSAPRPSREVFATFSLNF